MKSWVVERDEERYNQSLTFSSVRICCFPSRSKSRDLFNPYFGSIFRTHTVPTYFHRRLARFADVYTSNVCNFLDYPVRICLLFSDQLWYYFEFSLITSSFLVEWLYHMRISFPLQILIYF